MRYLVAYFKAFGFNFVFAGTAFLAFHVWIGDSGLAHYLLYTCAIASVAGPIKVLLKG